MTRHRHGGQRGPRIGRRLVRLDAAKRTDEVFGRHLAAGHVDPAAVRARRPPASRCRHPLLRNTPRVVHGVVLLHHIRVGSGQDEAVAGAAADDVDLAVDDTAERVVARHRHRPAALPLVRGGVVHIVGAENPRRSEEREERVLGPFHRRDAADHVDLAADFERPPRPRACRAAAAATSRNRPPDRTPTRRRWVPMRRRLEFAYPPGRRSHRSRKSCRSQRPGPHGGPAAASTFSSSICRWPGRTRRWRPEPCPRPSRQSRTVCR